MNKIDWKYTPEQALKIKAGDVDSIVKFYQENLSKMKLLISRRMQKLKNCSNEIFDEDDYLSEIYFRLPALNYNSHGQLTLSFNDNLIYIRQYRQDYYISKIPFFFTTEDGDEVPYPDLIGKYQPAYANLVFLQKDIYGIKANAIFEFVSKFMRTQRQKDVLLLFLEGYTYTNIMLKLDLKSNVLGKVYKQISFYLLSHYSEISEYLTANSGIDLKGYNDIYNIVKSELEAARKKQYEQTSKWLESNREKYKEIKKKSDSKYRAKQKALKNAI